MNNRMKQNRNLRPSKRQKFKGKNRDTIYSGSNKENKPTFKDFSDFQVKKAVDRFKQQNQSAKQLELILLLVSLGVGVSFLGYQIITKKNNPKETEIKTSKIDYDTSPPILWSGKRSDPLKLPFTNLYYAPKIGTLDFEIQIERTYEIYSETMIVDNTTNILFYDSVCNLTSKLLPKDGYISWMYVGPKKAGLGPKKILYALANNDTNKDGLINENDIENLFISELNGKELTKVTDRSISSMEWIGSGNELLIEFHNLKEKKDSLYGIFNTETKILRLANQKPNENHFEKQRTELK